MRTFKIDYIRALEDASDFNHMPLKFIKRGKFYRAAKEQILNSPNFTPVNQYQRGMLELLNEFGCDDTYRYILEYLDDEIDAAMKDAE